MNTKQLQLFLITAREGSFTAAENKALMSKQGIIRQLENLEDEIGVQLFHRTSAGITLTKAGVVLEKEVPSLLDRWQELMDQCRGTQPHQVLRLGQVDHQVILQKAESAFLRKYPDITIQKVIHPNQSGEWKLLNNIVDVAETFWMPWIPSQPIEFHKLCIQPFRAVMARDHPLAGTHALPLTSLVPYPTMVFRQFLIDEQLEVLKKTYRNYPEHLDVREDVDAQVSIAFALQESQHVLITPNPYVLSIQHLTCIPLALPWELQYGVICRKNPAPCVRQFIELAVQSWQMSSL